MELIVFSILLAAVIVFWIDYLIAKEFYAVAQTKGHFHKKYFWICFLLGVIGYLLVIALPDRSNESNLTGDDLPDL